MAAALVSCSNNELPAGHHADGFSLANLDHQKQVLETMEAQNIPYIINDRGFIVYLLKNQAQVHKIKRQVQHGKSLHTEIWESHILANDYVRNKYAAAFKENSIPFHITNKNGITQINWSQIHADKVDMLRQQLDIEIMEDYIDRATNKSSNLTLVLPPL